MRLPHRASMLNLLTVLTCGMGCNSGAVDGAMGKQEDVKKSQAPMGVSKDDDELADAPQMVAGAFLTCEMLDEEIGSAAGMEGEANVGCALMTDAGVVENIEEFDPEWRAVDDSGNEMASGVPSISAEHHMYFGLTNAQLGSTKVEVELHQGDATQLVAVTLAALAPSAP